MAISKDFLWSTIAKLAEELQRVDPGSVMAARVSGFLEARELGLSTSDRHDVSKRHYRAHDDKIVELYLSGKSTWDIAAQLSINAGTVSAALRRKGVRTRKGRASVATPQRLRDDGRLERIRQALSEGKTLAEIGQSEGISRERVRQICIRADIDSTKQPTPEEREAVNEYLGGSSLLEAAEHHRIHPNTLKRLLRRQGHEIRKKSRRHPTTVRNAKIAADLYRAGKTTYEIAQRLSVPQPNVYRLLAIAGVKPDRARKPLKPLKQEAA